MTIEEQEVLRQTVPKRKHIDNFFSWERGGFDMRLVDCWAKDICSEMWKIYGRQELLAMLTEVEFNDFHERFSKLPE